MRYIQQIRLKHTKKERRNKRAGLAKKELRRLLTSATSSVEQRYAQSMLEFDHEVTLLYLFYEADTLVSALVLEEPYEEMVYAYGFTREDYRQRGCMKALISALQEDYDCDLHIACNAELVDARKALTTMGFELYDTSYHYEKQLLASRYEASTVTLHMVETQADCEHWQRLHADSYYDGAVLLSQALMEHLSMEELASSFFLIKDMEQVVGCGRLCDFGQQQMLLSDLAIDVACRGRHLGTLALRAVLQMCHERGCTGLHVHVFGHNEAALKLYQNAQFSIKECCMEYRKCSI